MFFPEEFGKIAELFPSIDICIHPDKQISLILKSSKHKIIKTANYKFSLTPDKYLYVVNFFSAHLKLFVDNFVVGQHVPNVGDG